METTTDWKYGVDQVFWMEENPPSGPTWAYAVDYMPSHIADLMILLSKLNILDFGCFYESVDMIRLKP